MCADILHVDLDAFYVSVERHRRPELAGVPVIVGGAGARGVVLSCSYEAREAGVRNGMPGQRARSLCPDAVFVPPEFSAYGPVSREFRSILGAFTPLVEPISLDEAFCDVSSVHRLHGATADIAARIRERVRGELGLVCSVGGGSTKLVAKMASRACKPDGLLVVGNAEAFLRPRPVSELWGVGPATAAELERLGLRTIGDVADAHPSLLRRAVGDAAGEHLWRLARGIDPSPVTVENETKSVGAEETFPSDVGDDERVEAEILRLSDRVASRLVAGGLHGRTITLKIRLQDFSTHTRSRTVDPPTADVWTIYRVAREAYRRFRRGRSRVRLVGVSVSGLGSGPVAEQLSFERRPDYAEAERAVSKIRERFGSTSVRPARLLDD